MKNVEEIFKNFMETQETEDNAQVKAASRNVMDYISNTSKVDITDVDDLLTGLGYEYEK